ncbi:MAG: homing endonuclease [Enterobacter phage ENC9]|nr:MAG: homing endonuclease [Enterobacter phage ENC9]
MDYRKHYEMLVNRAKDRKIVGYTESHHIIPKCMNGPDTKDNLIDLTPEEHFVAHQLLVKLYPNNPGLVRACRMMCVSSKGQIRNNKEFGWIKAKWASMPGPMTGKSHSEETKLKMSESAKGKVKSKEHRLAISKTLKGVTYITDEGRQKIRETHLNKVVSEVTLKRMSESIIKINKDVTCPWCGKTGKLTGMKSWHFDRCKENPDGLQRQVRTN